MKKTGYLIVFIFFSIAVSLSFQNCAKVNYQARSIDTDNFTESANDTTSTPQPETNGCRQDAGQLQNRDTNIRGPSVLQIAEQGNFNLDGIDSCENIKSYIWSAGDGTADIPGLYPKFEYAYTAAGIYRVRADAIDNAGYLSRNFHQVSVPSRCQPKKTCEYSPKDVFISGPDMGRTGNSYKFFLMIPSDYTIKSVSWNFQDGSPIEHGLPEQSHIFNRSGVYDITALVEDDHGKKETLNHRITIIQDSSIESCTVEDAGISSPVVVRVHKETPFYLALPHCLQTQISTLNWDFGDGEMGGPLQLIRHAYKKKGFYLVTVNLYKKEKNDKPDLTFTRWIQVIDDHSPIKCDQPNPPTSPPPANLCTTEGQTSTSWSDVYFKSESCGTGGIRKDTYRDEISKKCTQKDKNLVWVETNRLAVLQNTGKCLGQSCKLPNESKNQIKPNAPGVQIINGELHLADGTVYTFYSNMRPAGKCADIGVERRCANGELSNLSTPCSNCGNKISFNIYLECIDGCKDFGKHGTTKKNILLGQLQVPKACKYGEKDIFDTYEKIGDQLCDKGQMLNSNERKGKLIRAGICPSYRWVATNKWSECSEDCGGKQTQVFECQNEKNEKVDNARCDGSAPAVARICDKNPQKVKKDSVISTENNGSCTTCPANEIGIVLGQRTVTTISTYTCQDHKYKIANTERAVGPWSYETYCRPFTAVRCSHDSLSQTESQQRYQWMEKCAPQVPFISEFLNKFKDVEFTGADKWGKQLNRTSLVSRSRSLYPTFMNAENEKPWIAPKLASASCDVPAKAYVAAVCVSSCATPEQEILAANGRKLTFIQALTQKTQNISVAKSYNVVQEMRVDQWVTELVDSDHKILIFKMESGGTLKLTFNHGLIDGNGIMREAETFQIGDSLVKLNGTLDRVISIEKSIHKGKVYNVFLKSDKPEDNIVITNGYLNGSAYFQNEGHKFMNREILRQRLIEGVLK